MKTSLENQQPEIRKWWVYSRGYKFGPYFQGQAEKVAAELEATNYTGLKPMYIVSTED